MMTRVALAVTTAVLIGGAAMAETPPAKGPEAPGFELVLEPRAIDLLKATSARLAAAQAMSFTAVASYEYPSKLGPPIVYSVRYEVAMRRPNQLKIVIPGDGPASEFYYDGKSIMAYAPAENLVAVAEAPATLDAALRFAYEKAAIFYPFTDLLLDDPFAALAHKANLAFYVGPSEVVGGIRTDMVAWGNDDVFLQIWIGSEDKLPRRIRAVYSADPQLLRHELELSNWRLDPSDMPDLAASEKVRTGQRIPFANPTSPLPPGVKPLFEKP